jgi:hypothetical protein
VRLPNWPRWVWRCYAATFAAVAAFVVCSFLPHWEIRETWCGVLCMESRPPGTLWEMATYRKPAPLSADIYVVDVAYVWEAPAIVTAIAMHIAAIVGFFWGGVRRKGERSHPPSPSP